MDIYPFKTEVFRLVYRDVSTRPERHVLREFLSFTPILSGRSCNLVLSHRTF